MKKILQLLMLFLVKQVIANAQGLNTPKPLKIGEFTPNVYLESVQNYPSKQAHLKDFVKGKRLLIIDFWNRGCSSCIEGMPKAEKLQDKFSTDVQIIYVLNPGDSPYFETLRSRIPNVRNLKLPHVSGDSLLYKYLFAHQNGDPYQIWLDQDLKVIASSDQAKLNEANVETYLSGGLNFVSKGNATYLRDYY